MTVLIVARLRMITGRRAAVRAQSTMRRAYGTTTTTTKHCIVTSHCVVQIELSKVFEFFCCFSVLRRAGDVEGVSRFLHLLC